MDNFKILNIPSGSSKEDIKIAYRRLAKKLHPDINKGCVLKAKEFIKVNEAYKELMLGITGESTNATHSTSRSSTRVVESFQVKDGAYNNKGEFVFHLKLSYVQKIYLCNSDIYWRVDSTLCEPTITLSTELLKKCNYKPEFRIVGWRSGNSLYKSYTIKKPKKPARKKSSFEKFISNIFDKLRKFLNFTK